MMSSSNASPSGIAKRNSDEDADSPFTCAAPVVMVCMEIETGGITTAAAAMMHPHRMGPIDEFASAE